MGAAVLLLSARPATANDRVELRPVRFTLEGGSQAATVARLGVGTPETARPPQRNNLNRRLVAYPAPLPRAERQAAVQAAEAARWTHFAAQHLQDGDVLFRLGNARTHLIMNFSRVTALVTDSRYSHTGIVRWNGGVAEVVDITQSGFRVQAFSGWMREVADGKFAVHRLRREYRERIPDVLAFLAGKSEARPAFDFKFDLRNDQYYCNELTELAYRSVGLRLSEPVPVQDLPRMKDAPVWAWLTRVVGGVNMANPVYVAGNDAYGMLASPLLQPVYTSPDAPRPAEEPPVTIALLSTRF